ncbi:hypothetical protein HELRODRAFT_102934 [Helobdella robusta]|uniref:Vacuolar protein sorting-associated protein 11 homolog n=1 Tax=Helobdella robusta TaxID=6412 RepID=T1EDD3_HELRO|nr:hypothetical protein HELRODRAFT_102934 [Helobdella robusta]ESN94748.1 hypothetical protein HELRODRAFT_102934 [Helobdella robusta]
MSFLQWRRFTFFEKEQVRGLSSASDGGGPGDLFSGQQDPFENFKDVSWTCSTCGKGLIVLGDEEGFIYTFDHQFNVNSFRAYTSVVHLVHQLKQYNILVTVGEDEEKNAYFLKVWNLDKVDRAGTPACPRVVRVTSSVDKNAKPTSLAVHENMNHMAVGFSNACVMLFTGDIMKDKHSKSRYLFEGQGHQENKVTALVFKTTNQQVSLFVATETEVVRVHLLPRDRDQKLSLDSKGCNGRCCLLLTDKKQLQQFIVARQDAVYFYEIDGRGPCLAFEGEKLQVHSYKGYLIIVTRESQQPINRAEQSDDNDSSSEQQQPQQQHQQQPQQQQHEINVLTIYDLQNKFIAYSAPFNKIFNVFVEWGSLFVLCSDFKLYNLQERDTQYKLDLLFKKNLYDLAVSLAQQHDQSGLADIYKQYGDHLYNKGDHDGAMLQYIKTIGQLEASYVIRKFIDASRIHNLTYYLQELHEKGLTNDDHITLLLNCYTKLKDVEKLDQFIMTHNLNYDAETTIRVCRSAGYHKQALHVAEKYNKTDWLLKIQLEQIKDYKKALDCISKLDREEAELYMKKYGKELLEAEPDLTTKFIIKLCTDDDGGSSSPKRKLTKADDFMHIFVNKRAQLTTFLECLTDAESDSTPNITNTLLEMYLYEYAKESDAQAKKNIGEKILMMLKDKKMKYDTSHALVLCQLHDFSDGMICLYEQNKRFMELLLHLTSNDEHDKIIDTCLRYGSMERDLWIHSLIYFAKRNDPGHNHYIKIILDNIEKCNIMPMLKALRILSEASNLDLSIVEDYIKRAVKRDNETKSDNEKVIEKYVSDTKMMRNQIQISKTQAKVMQNQRCSICMHSLDLPSLHFFCDHSCHLHCFESYSENTNECPLCYPTNKKLMENLYSQRHDVGLHETLQRRLNSPTTTDRFAVVAEYFSMGLFEDKDKMEKPEEASRK